MADHLLGQLLRRAAVRRDDPAARLPHGCFLRVITASNPQVRTRPVTAGERADAPLLAAYGVRKWSGSLRFCNSR